MGLLNDILIKLPLWSVRKVLHILFIASVGALFVGIIGFIFYMKSLPALNIWHTTILQNEFHADGDVKDFDAYVALENRLFDELDRKIYNKYTSSNTESINR